MAVQPCLLHVCDPECEGMHKLNVHQCANQEYEQIQLGQHIG